MYIYMYIYICIYIYMYIYMYICIYVCIERERNKNEVYESDGGALNPEPCEVESKGAYKAYVTGEPNQGPILRIPY